MMSHTYGDMVTAAQRESHLCSLLMRLVKWVGGGGGGGGKGVSNRKKYIQNTYLILYSLIMENKGPSHMKKNVYVAESSLLVHSEGSLYLQNILTYSMLNRH